ncbi:LLM class oxidoreductase [Sulfitobacter sp. S190]|uniref:LLM class oxidoreductase n=1 Tax=Sulfitobacter sp. S190 TaxID=2867022 RepID=UPI0021A27A24|nr:LLM class oxidoreductase [Sulfitobacter sp. S190]UWR24590.1 LLM class oxidoreductase [Sulfitobacter sp. S190]
MLRVSEGAPSHATRISQSALDLPFVRDRLTLGLLFPIESYAGDMPMMIGQEILAQRAEALGFTALWFRDVPLRVPSFGDMGQVYDPFVYMAWMAAHTSRITLGTAASILPLRHPLHTAKMAASLDQLSKGRILLGVASGDRAQEYPAFRQDIETRGEAFQESFKIIRDVLGGSFPSFHSEFFGTMSGTSDLLPKPAQPELPLLVVGGAQQDLGWIAQHSRAWVMYPRPITEQKQVVHAWQTALRKADGVEKPFAQSLYIDLSEDPNSPPTSIHLGFRSGRNYLLGHLNELRSIGVSHVLLNLKYGERPAADVVEELGAFVIPQLI